MSEILERLQAAFDGMPIVVAPIVPHTRPTPAARVELADYVAALANAPQGGLLVLGLDPEDPHHVIGLNDAGTWRALIREAAGTLVPPVALEVRIGREAGHAIVAAHVAPVMSAELVRRPNAPPVRLHQGRPVIAFTRVRGLRPPGTLPPALAPIEHSNPTWLDPLALARVIGATQPLWTVRPRELLVRHGFLSPGGLAVTRAGLLLAGLPERRDDEDAIVVHGVEGVRTLPRGWLLLPADLRAECRKEGVRDPEAVADLAIEVLVRTAAPAPNSPLAVHLAADVVTIETRSPVRDDAELLRMLTQWSQWRPRRWEQAATAGRVSVSWERNGQGLRVRVTPTASTPAGPHRPSAASALPAPGVSSSWTAPPSPPPAATAPDSTTSKDAGTLSQHQPRATREAMVLALLEDGQTWSRRDLAARLGWSRSTLRNVLEALVASGRVVADARSPRSPFQAYRVG